MSEDNEVVFLDTETSGFSRNHEVLEVGAICVGPSDEIDSDAIPFHAYLIPKGPVDNHHIHGLTRDFLLEHGRDQRKVFAELKRFIGKRPVIGHNVSFDKRMIVEGAARVGVEIDFDIGFDTLSVARRHIKKGTVPSNRLMDLVTTFNLHEGIEFHTAIDDCIATVRLANHFQERGWL